MKELIQKLVQTFCFVITGSLFATTLFITFLSPKISFGVEVLWQIIILSFFSSNLSIIFYSSKELSKKQLLRRKILHFFLLNIVLLGCAYYFHWFMISEIGKSIIFVILSFIVYVFVSISCFSSEKKQAATLNEKIKQYQKKS